MTTQEVANKLVEYCRKGDFDGAIQELYAPGIVSIEPAGSPTERVEGIEAVIQKGKQFTEMMEQVHSTEVSEPVVAENFFSCSMIMDVTFKGAPGPTKMEEICLYQVQDGKVVQEQFFYTPQQPQG